MWSVKLAGKFAPYDPHLSDAIEDAHHRGEPQADLTLRNSQYTIDFASMRQILKADTTRTRPVRRTDKPTPQPQAPTQPAAAPPPQPAAAAPPMPTAVPPAAPPAPSPQPPAATASGAPPRAPPSAAPPAAAQVLDFSAEDDDAVQPPPSKKKKRRALPAAWADTPPAPAAKPAAEKAVAAALPTPIEATGAGGSSDSAAAGSRGALWPVAENNDKIVDMLMQMSDSERIAGDTFKASMYKKAAASVKEWASPITDGAKAAKDIKGVGKKIGEKIDELLTTGTLARLEREAGASGPARALKELQRVSGIGVKKAEELIALGIIDLVMLSARTDLLNKEQRIGLAHVGDFEARIPRVEAAAIAAQVELAASEMDPPLLAVACGSLRRGAETCGDVDVLLCNEAYRTTADAPPDKWLAKLVHALEADGLITDVISLGAKKCAAVCRLVPKPESLDDAAAKSFEVVPEAPTAPAVRIPTTAELEAKRKAKRAGALNLFQAGTVAPPAPAPTEPAAPSPGASEPLRTWVGGFDDFSSSPTSSAPAARFRRLDLKLVPYESFHFATLSFTGSDTLNTKMRARAQELGLKLSEYALVQVDKETGTPIDAAPYRASSERDIFELLAMDYLAPTERTLT